LPCQLVTMVCLQRTAATPGSLRPKFSAMTPVYSCPIHGSCNAVRAYDTTAGCSLYATPPYNGPRRAGVTRRHTGSARCCRGDRCRSRLIASTSPFTGSSSCLAASRRQADSVDDVLPSVTALDVVDVATKDPGLRPPTVNVDHTAAEKADTDSVFYTANSQHPQACNHVGNLLFATSWGREHHSSSTAYDLPANDRQRPVHTDGQQLVQSDATSDQDQPTLLVDFHC